jgi:hypothetical protein
MDGTVPGYFNCRCVEAGLQAALALGSQINLVSFFDRKVRGVSVSRVLVHVIQGDQVCNGRCVKAAKSLKGLSRRL